MATPSPSPSPPPPQSPTASDPPSPQPTTAKKPQPIPWTHQETVHLIQAYQEKWYSLKRGPLKAGQWEEVAVTVAARCGYDYPSKTSTQCRHKIEKLRTRHRSEKQRLASGSLSVWPFFRLMESLERGPLPISAHPMSQVPYHHRNDNGDEDGDVGDEDDDEIFSKSQSINYILRRPTVVNRFAPERKFSVAKANGVVGGGAGYFREPAGRNPPREAIEDQEDSLESKLASEIRAFSERFMGMENTKMKLIKETERFRMDMERKRMEMILQSQQKIVDTVSRAFGSRKKMKMKMSDDEES